MLLEREPELGRMREAIRHAGSGPGGLVVIGGPAGIGKTALLQAAAGMAERAGVRVLRGRGSDIEQEFAFGVVRQLFEGPLARAGVEQREALLQGAAQLAGPLFESGPAAAAPPVDGPAGATRPEDGPAGASRPKDVPPSHPPPAPRAGRRHRRIGGSPSSTVCTG